MEVTALTFLVDEQTLADEQIYLCFFRVVINRQANKLWFLVKVVPEKPLGDVKVCVIRLLLLFSCISLKRATQNFFFFFDIHHSLDLVIKLMMAGLDIKLVK